MYRRPEILDLDGSRIECADAGKNAILAILKYNIDVTQDDVKI